MYALFEYNEDEHVGQPTTMLSKDPETDDILFMEHTEEGKVQAVSKSGRIFPCKITAIRLLNLEEGIEVTLV